MWGGYSSDRKYLFRKFRLIMSSSLRFPFRSTLPKSTPVSTRVSCARSNIHFGVFGLTFDE